MAECETLKHPLTKLGPTAKSTTSFRRLRLVSQSSFDEASHSRDRQPEPHRTRKRTPCKELFDDSTCMPLRTFAVPEIPSYEEIQKSRMESRSQPICVDEEIRKFTTSSPMTCLTRQVSIDDEIRSAENSRKTSRAYLLRRNSSFDDQMLRDVYYQHQLSMESDILNVSNNSRAFLTQLKGGPVQEKAAEEVLEPRDRRVARLVACTAFTFLAVCFLMIGVSLLMSKNIDSIGHLFCPSCIPIKHLDRTNLLPRLLSMQPITALERL